MLHSKSTNLFFIVLAIIFTILTSCDNKNNSSKNSVTQQKIIIRKKIVNKTIVKKPKTIKKKIEKVPAKQFLPQDKLHSKQVKKDEKTEQESLASAQKRLLSKYDAPYSPIGKINPFIPLFMEKQERTINKKRRIPLTPLEKLSLSQLTLVGIVQAKSGNKALVEESNGKGYIVIKGTYIGKNSGIVKGILEDKIIIEESVENVLGKVSTQIKELKLNKPVGE